MPDLTLPADDGSTVRFKDLRGQPVVVYFYPRDDTPGCTREACAFRDRKAELTKLGAKVFGISTDDVKSHVKFRDKFQLNFPLLADVDHKAAEAFGAWQEKNMYGKKSMGVVRSTFVADAAGVIRKAWHKVNVDGHDAEVIAAVAELSGHATAAAKPMTAKPAKPTKKAAATKPSAAKVVAAKPAKKKTAKKTKPPTTVKRKR